MNSTRSMRYRMAGVIIALCPAFYSLPVLAEKADRAKPINLEADRATADDSKKTQVFEGNVQLTQGTLLILAERLSVVQDSKGFQRSIALGATGGLAKFRQKREGRNDFVEGEANRIEHDSKTDVAEFFGNAVVKSGGDEVRGPYIRFDSRSEVYSVNAGPNATSSGASGRVHAVIQPKNVAE